MTGTASASNETEKLLPPADRFEDRHLEGPDAIAAMLDAVGCERLEDLVAETLPAHIRTNRPLVLPPAATEAEVLEELRAFADQNRVGRSFLGMGYYGTRTPAVIQRNVLENPAWYTQYTPYQAEISQGRLEALLNFQTLVSDLCGLPLSNSSLLDEATAAAEAMTMCWSAQKRRRARFVVSRDCHPQTLGVLRTRALPLGIEVAVAETDPRDSLDDQTFAMMLQIPATDGRLFDARPLISRAQDSNIRTIVATDLLALMLMRSPGEMGADVAVGSSQRFGVPMGFGGPHAAFLAAREEFKRLIPGRVVGVSRDSAGRPALRLAMQTREQHIRRDKATSNICTAQVLLAVLASMYAVYHGPEGLRRIALRVHRATQMLAAGLRAQGHRLRHEEFFDTLRIEVVGEASERVLERAKERGFYLRWFENGDLGIALDETVTESEIADLLACCGGLESPSLPSVAKELRPDLAPELQRTDAVLEHEVFHLHRTEHEMLRYIHRLQSRELSLTHSMIPLGSCTMKLNASAEMSAVTWPEFSSIHPFAPAEDTVGYRKLIDDLQVQLCEITGYPAVSLQPNAGAQGEYAGLLVIRAYQRSQGEGDRDVCLIPLSAHGTNPASAVMAGLTVVGVRCDDAGNIDLDDLRERAAVHASRLSALMITYPSTHGVFEPTIKEICAIVHEHGGQVYLDGANMNAQVGLARPAEMGADVCHLNLHKTFAIPHGGGGPGMGPIGVAEHLAAHLPGHPIVNCGGSDAIGPVSAAPWGSPSILPISWSYVRMMGSQGLQRASQLAILNANYMAWRLREHYDILYTGDRGRVAHEFILDVRPFKESAGVGVDDLAKRLMDYGFHAPTMSWPVAGTLMVEPTESESKAELDRYCEALISIRLEIRAIEEGEADRKDNVLRNAPHTVHDVSRDDWARPYTREQAAFPASWLRSYKFWPTVGRVDNTFGDRNLICTCPSVEEFA